MTTEQTFLDLPETPTFNVWRIEQFKVVPWTDFGAFYTGDSYIVLNAQFVGTSKRVKRDIFYWIGAESTQDEYGTAAIKAVELDDRFDGEPTQHRETQYHESEAFVKLFDQYGGVRYMDGGTPSGFRPVNPETGAQLFQVKGRRRPVLIQREPVGKSLNQGDVFLVVSAQNLFLWIGTNANLAEKMKGAQLMDVFKAKYSKAKFTRLEGGETTPEFWAALGGETPIASAEEGQSDQEAEVENTRYIFKVEGESFTKVAEGAAATKDKLNSDSQFCIQQGTLVFVFNGSKVPRDVSKHSLELGAKFLTDQKLPSWCPITVVKEGTASDVFDVIFT